MLNLHVIRHAPSWANEKQTIQGQLVDSQISEQGRDLLLRKIADRFIDPQNLSGIICSDAVRAQRTAEEIANTYKLPIQIEPMLREVDPGIISGKNKIELAQQYPDELDIWHRYGDLDGIEKAERGDQVQARALAFLAKMKKVQPDGNYILVSHAAFIRSLLNTIEGRPRETRIDHRHLEPAIVSDALSKQNFMKLGKTFSSEVYKVSTVEQDFIIKYLGPTSRQKMMSQADITNYLFEYGLAPANLFSTTYDLDQRENGLMVNLYIPGVTLLEDRRANDFFKICDLMKNIKKTLQSYPEKSSSDLTLLGDQIPKILGNLEAHRISEKAFLTSERLSFLFNASSNSDIVDHDCHYGNFLRDVNGIIHKIDISPLLAPRLYQEASLLLSAFLLKNPADISMLENFCSVWSISPKQQSELRVAMALRACAGIAYFDRIQKEMGYNPDAQIISQQYQHCFQAFNQV